MKRGAANSKTLYFVANARIPTERAHGVHIIKMCEAFASRGLDVELIIPRRYNELPNNPYDYYSVKRNFKIRKLWTLDWAPTREPAPAFFYWLQSLTFAVSLFFFVLQRKKGFIYLRFDAALLWALFPFLGRREIICEAHFLLDGIARKFMMRCDSIVVVNEEAKRLYEPYTDLDEKILVAPDGVALSDYRSLPSKRDIRAQLKLPLNKKLIVYTGYFYTWKGVAGMVHAARYARADEEWMLIGGSESDRAPIQKIIDAEGLKNIHLLGYKPYRDIARYQKAADCLVVSATITSPESKFFTSPLKLFEYMATGNPIVAPRTPALEEVLQHERNALLVSPDDPKAFADGISRVLSNERLAHLLGQNAMHDAERYDWRQRAEHIFQFIECRAKAPRVLYLYAGERRALINEWHAGGAADSQLIGLNHLAAFGIRAHYYETLFMNRLRKIHFHLAQFPALLRLHKYDAVFLGSNLFFVFFIKRILCLKKPSIVFYNTFFTNTLKRHQKGIIGYCIQKAIIAIDMIICPSTAQRDFLMSEGFDPKKIITVLNGVDADFFMPRQWRDDLSAISFIGSIGKDMGRDYKTLIDAADGFSGKTYIVAAPRNFKNIPIIPDNIVILYHKSHIELRDLLSNASLVVVPTFSESHIDASDCSGQYGTLEAMAMGKAIVVSARSTIYDYITHGENAYIIPPENVGALQAAIKLIFLEPNLRLALEKNARRAVESKFTTKHLAKALSDVFKIIT